MDDRRVAVDRCAAAGSSALGVAVRRTADRIRIRDVMVGCTVGYFADAFIAGCRCGIQNFIVTVDRCTARCTRTGRRRVFNT